MIDIYSPGRDARRLETVPAEIEMAKIRSRVFFSALRFPAMSISSFREGRRLKESVGVESEWCVCRNLIIGVSGGGVSNCSSGLQVNHAGLYRVPSSTATLCMKTDRL